MIIDPAPRLLRPAIALAASFLLVVGAHSSAALQDSPRCSDDTGPLPTVTAKTAGMEPRPGLLDLWVESERGRVWLAVPPAGDGELAGTFLYVEGLVVGLGSNPVGLDRGQIGETRVVHLRRVGSKVLFEVPNLAFRALEAGPDESAAVHESFASSVLWGAEIVARDPDGRSLVDFTSFIVRDAHGVVRRLAGAGQGEFGLEGDRSAVRLEGCLAFERNLELEAVLTFTSSKTPGHEVRATAPDPEAVTLVQHHSLIALPDEGYRPRAFDPRAGSFAITFADYTAPLDRPLERRWIVRHRLEKVLPGAEPSAVVRPIVYYVDRAVPEPVRTALLEGAGWWEEAFAAAGFQEAFKVELLPPGVHPLDIRYNVIQWVHRATRGWSYGGGVVDPRTGEMIKGHVSLGSLRVRQDMLIFEGLAGVGAGGSGAADDPERLALARLRQLAVHEVGHTLGLAHNFAASTYGGRASVMDYPAPLIRVSPQGELDFSAAYAEGLGIWDLFAIRHAYAELPRGSDEEEALEAMVHEALAQGLVFLTDEDARPAGAAHPLASLWDNGADPVAELANVLAVRGVALRRFGEANIGLGRPLALLQETLAPVFFYHRFQVTAAAKSLGGLDYRHALRGDGQPAAHPVDGGRQRRALAALLEAVDPAVLDLPEAVLELLPPRPPGFGLNRELFEGYTAPVFDALAAAATACDLVVAEILQPQRLARMVDFHRRDSSLPSAEEAISALVTRVFQGSPRLPREAELIRAAQSVVAARLVGLAANDTAAPLVRAQAENAVRGLVEVLGAPGGDGTEQAFRRALREDLVRFLTRREWRPLASSSALPPPPGDPIGGSGWE